MKESQHPAHRAHGHLCFGTPAQASSPFRDATSRHHHLQGVLQKEERAGNGWSTTYLLTRYKRNTPGYPQPHAVERPARDINCMPACTRYLFFFFLFLHILLFSRSMVHGRAGHDHVKNVTFLVRSSANTIRPDQKRGAPTNKTSGRKGYAGQTQARWIDMNEEAVAKSRRMPDVRYS
jgi:hypothetical protein